jgi:hypothetical protein
MTADRGSLARTRRRTALGCSSITMAALVVLVGSPTGALAQVPPGSVTLQAISTPLISGAGDQKPCHPSIVTAATQQLMMGGQDYKSGFMLNGGGCGATVYSWHIGGEFSSLSAAVGLDVSDTAPAQVEFLNAQGKALPFKAGGQTVDSLSLVPGVPTAVVLGLTGAQGLTIQVAATISGRAVAVDFGDDALRGR